MTFLSGAPSNPSLEGIVERLWWAEGTASHRFERLVPSGKPQLLVNLHEPELRTYDDVPAATTVEAARARRIGGAGLSGVYDRPIVIDTASQRSVIGVSLTITGAAALVGDVSAETIAGAHVDLRDLWGVDGAVLRERLLGAATPEGQLATLERALGDHVARTSVARSDMQRMQRALDELDGSRSLRDLCRDLGASERSFRRHVKRWVGIGPKRLARLRRFGRVLTAIEQSTHDVSGGVDWAWLATDVGYFDQAHLIGEFRSFGGMTPTAYRAHRPASRHHVPL